jgi:hypothetical protein
MSGEPGSLLVSPNPSSGQFIIITGDKDLKDASIEVMNYVGQVIFTERLTAITDNTPVKLNNIASGLYIMHVSSMGMNYSTVLVIE